MSTFSDALVSGVRLLSQGFAQGQDAGGAAAPTLDPLSGTNQTGRAGDGASNTGLLQSSLFTD
jgi:hypothetical protein